MDALTPSIRATGAPAWRRWLMGDCRAYPVLLGLALAGGSAAALARGVAPVPLLASGCALLAAWYLGWAVYARGRLTGSVVARAVHFAGASLLWLGLMSLDRSYGAVGVVISAGLFDCLKPRAALAGMAAVDGAIVVAGGVHGAAGGLGGLSWQGIAPGPAAGTGLVLALVALCLYLGRTAATARAEAAASQRETGVLAERGRLAAELHDTVTQSLASVVMLLEAGGDGNTRQALATSRDALSELRGLVWNLRPEQQPLEVQLRTLVARWGTRTGIHADTVITGTARPLPPETEVTLLRVAREALTNTGRHSDARHATVTVSYLDDMVALDVYDDGIGFDPAACTPPGPGGGLGLPGMRSRIEAAGGTLSIESTPSAGTSVAAQLPVDPAPVETRL